MRTGGKFVKSSTGYDLGIHEGYQFHGPRTQLGVERPFWRDRLLASLSWNLQYLNFFNIDTAAFNPATMARTAAWSMFVPVPTPNRLPLFLYLSGT